ncbi:hypothetical protein [Mycolicibacterium pallens]|uniref:Transmembrane protein n=1 Tax=Mycolicibacterium pallens TaxID=370524 RepID=A0ABX8VQB1_9MYCO|nr:hypothetical protein [Mycolicibacterium pallens]APE16841.1 hypothetical protein BOH72_17915 [Mycobacterium sp. WY10]QYL17691.1 hypothetical protein K0O64_03750 [Mycolicibacterium pallens]
MRHLIQLIVAALAVAGAVVTGLAARSVVVVAPIADGQPSTTSAAFDPPLMLLTWLLITAAGVLAVLGVAGLVRARRARAVRTPASDPPAPEPS